MIGQEKLNCEKASSGSGELGERYYSGGNIYRLPKKDISPAWHLIRVNYIDAQQVRQQHNETTEAWEITFRIDGAEANEIAKNLQPGGYFAFEPKNNHETVQAILDNVKLPENGMATVPVYSGRFDSYSFQTLPARDIVSGVIDVTHPTPQLINLLAKCVKEKGGVFPKTFDAQKIADCYTVKDLLEHYPDTLTLEELCANQPLMNARVYTISDFDREKATFKLIVSNVKTHLSKDDPLKIKGSKHLESGTATEMLLDIAKSQARDYPINGYLPYDRPRLIFPGITEITPGLKHTITYDAYVKGEFKKFEGETHRNLYLLGNGVGIAPHLAFLRELSHRKAKDPKYNYPGKIVLMNAARYPEDELYAEECRKYVKQGLLDEYYSVFAETGEGKKVAAKDGELREETHKKPLHIEGRYYVQHAFESLCREGLEKELLNGETTVYICGTIGAYHDLQNGRFRKVFIVNPSGLESTASLPSRFYKKFLKENKSVDYHIPHSLPVLKIPEVQDGLPDWTQKMRYEPISRADNDNSIAGGYKTAAVISTIVAAGSALSGFNWANREKDAKARKKTKIFASVTAVALLAAGITLEIGLSRQVNR